MTRYAIRVKTETGFRVYRVMARSFESATRIVNQLNNKK